MPEPSSLPTDAQPSAAEDGPRVGGSYRWYICLVLMVVYVFNFIDRQILSILAEEIKADLKIDDAQIGFLYGTAFAVFYALFGIPLGRLADVWVRKSLISLGLTFWSVMTALSGTARSFLSLGAYRIGVGVGEASASPAAFSMLSDYFSPKQRATAMAVYSSGVYIGSGIGLFIGGWIVDGWASMYSDGGAPFNLKGWHVAYFVVGLPGLLMALWVRTLREPPRGQSEGLAPSKPHPDPFGELFRELIAVLPPLTLYSLYRLRAGKGAYVINLMAAVGVAAGAAGLIAWTGAKAQWIALGIGVYAAISWSQSLALRDRPTFSMILKSRAIVFGLTGFACITFTTYGVGFWSPPFFIRVHGVSAKDAGMILGLASAAGGWIGVTGGGLLSDRLKQETPRARVYVGMASAVLTALSALFILRIPDTTAAYAGAFVYNIFSSFWVGSAVALANELVLPRMRGMVSAFYLLLVTFIGLALGPFTIGQISNVLTQSGADSGDALRTGMTAALAILGVAFVCFIVAARYVEAEETGRIERARAAGEPDV